MNTLTRTALIGLMMTSPWALAEDTVPVGPGQHEYQQQMQRDNAWREQRDERRQNAQGQQQGQGYGRGQGGGQGQGRGMGQ